MRSRSTIVFVDDEPCLLTGLRRALHAFESRWRMIFSTSAEAAIDIVQHERPTLVVTDLRMPEMSGFELITAARPLSPRTRYIILSGMADFAAAQAAINECRVFRLLTKPCKTPLLIDALSDALNDQRRGPDPSCAWNAMEAWTAGVIVVDRAALTIKFANGVAQALLNRRDGVMRDENGRLRALQPQATADLVGLIQAAAPGDITHARLPRSQEKRDLCVSIRAAQQDDGVTLVMTDPELCASPGAEALRALFGLSAKEAEIVHALCEGRSVEEAADIAELTVSTARTYLKRIFVKTDTSRQADLVRLALSTPDVRSGSV